MILTFNYFREKAPLQIFDSKYASGFCDSVVIKSYAVGG